MAQIIVRNLDDDVRDTLRELAKRNGRSMEEEVREILRTAALTLQQLKESDDDVGLGTRIARRFEGIGLDEDIPELRGQDIEPISFDG